MKIFSGVINNWKLKELLFFLIFFLLIAPKIRAQLSAYHGIVFPYDNLNKTIQTLGSLTYAVSDFTANVQNNPVSLSFIKNPQIYLNFYYSISKYSFDSNTTPEKYVFSPGSISGAFPLNVFKKNIVFAATVNNIHSPEHEIWAGDWLTIQNQRNGRVWNGSLGINCKLDSNTNISFSWSKWFGSWSFDYETPLKTIYGNGTFHYNGNTINIGVLKQYNSVFFSFIMHTPFTLMTADDVFLSKRGFIEKYLVKQRFNGAIKVGFSYQWTDKINLSTGYRFQNKSFIEKQIIYDGQKNQEKIEYSTSHQISVAGKYILYIKGVRLPISFLNRFNWKPKIPYYDYGYLQYQYLSNDNTNINYAISLNLKIPYNNLLVFLSSQWDFNPIDVTVNHNSKYYSIGGTKKTFQAKKSTFLFNIGVSYTFR